MIESSPAGCSSSVSATARGRPTTMPAKMISEMPLPMPRSVICSPSHMTKAEPVVRVSTVSRRNPQPGVEHQRRRRRASCVFSRKSAMPNDWMIEITHRAVAGVLGDLLAARARPSLESFSR